MGSRALGRRVRAKGAGWGECDGESRVDLGATRCEDLDELQSPFKTRGLALEIGGMEKEPEELLESAMPFIAMVVARTIRWLQSEECVR